MSLAVCRAAAPLLARESALGGRTSARATPPRASVVAYGDAISFFAEPRPGGKRKASNLDSEQHSEERSRTHSFDALDLKASCASSRHAACRGPARG